MKPTSAIRVPRTQAVANPSAAIFVPSGRYGALMFIRPCSGTAPCRNLTILRALWHNLFRDAVK